MPLDGGVEIALHKASRELVYFFSSAGYELDTTARVTRTIVLPWPLAPVVGNVAQLALAPMPGLAEQRGCCVKSKIKSDCLTESLFGQAD